MWLDSEACFLNTRSLDSLGDTINLTLGQKGVDGGHDSPGGSQSRAADALSVYLSWG